MKKKYLLIATLIVMLGISLGGCYVERGYQRPYHHHYHHDDDHYGWNRDGR